MKQEHRNLGRQRYWTADRIMDQILQIVESGEDLSYTGLCESGMAGMYAAAKQVFGTWATAVEASGIPVDLASRRSHENSWTEKKVLRAILAREAEGHGLAHVAVKEDDNALLMAALHRFGSWRNAVEAAGFDYDEHLRSWDRDTTAGLAFESLVDRALSEAGWEYKRHHRFPYPGEERNYVVPDFILPGDRWWDAKLNANAPHVQQTIERYLKVTDHLTIVYLTGVEPEEPTVEYLRFDDLLAALDEVLDQEFMAWARGRAEEISDRDVEQTKLEAWAVHWTRERIIEAIGAMHIAGESLLANEVRKTHPKLYGAVMDKPWYSSWYDAVSAAGFDGEALQAQGKENKRLKKIVYTKEICQRRVRELERLGSDLSNKGLFSSDPSLAAALVRNWGTVYQALDEFGIDPEHHRRQEAWSREKVMAGLKQRQRAGETMLLSHVRDQAPNLFTAAVRHFGSIEHAAAAAGVDIVRHKKGAAWFVDGEFSPDRFSQCIQEYHEGGGSLIALDVLVSAPELNGAARRHMGSWYAALEQFGYPVETLRKAARQEHRKWSREKIIEEVHALVAAGESVSYSDLRYGGRLSLVGMGEYTFGSWSATLVAAGLDPAEHRKPRKTKWSRKRLIEAISERHASGGGLSVTTMLKEASALYGSARAYFGSWPEALLAAGIDPEPVKRGPPLWPKRKIVRALKRLSQEQGSLSPTILKAHSTSLYDALFRQFDCFEAACDAADVPHFRERRLEWTNEEITAEIQRLHREGEKLWSTAVRKNHAALFSAAVSKWHFGSWRKAIEAAGIDYEVLLAKGRKSRAASRRRWSEERVIHQIREIVRSGESLRPSLVNKQKKPLYLAAVRLFGSWRKAVEASGYTYTEHVRARRGR